MAATVNMKPHKIYFRVLVGRREGCVYLHLKLAQLRLNAVELFVHSPKYTLLDIFIKGVYYLGTPNY